MSVQKVNVLVPPLRPRSAAARSGSAQCVAWLVRRAMPASGSGLPALARGRSVAKLAVDRAPAAKRASRADLIALACRYQATQPEFAKDLFAAACNDRGR